MIDDAASRTGALLVERQGQKGAWLRPSQSIPNTPGLRGSLSTVSVVDALAEALRKRVLDGLLAPGTGVTESQVAADYNVARPTAKSAIMTLVHEGILRRQAHRAAFVPRLSPEDVADIFLVRIPLEIEVIEQLIARNLAPDGAKSAIERLSTTAADSVSHSDFAAADLLFHRILVDAVASERLSRLYKVIEGEIHLCMVQASMTMGREVITAQHLSIFNALESRDRDAAVVAMRSHLIGARDALQHALSDGEQRPSR